MVAPVYWDSEYSEYWATVKGKTEALKLLLQHGGGPHRADRYGKNPVHKAASNGKTEALQLLLQHGGDPNRADQYGATPVHYAAARGNTEALQLLLQSGGDPNNKVLALLKAAGGKQ